MTRVHEELQAVLNQLEQMDAGIVKFNPYDLPEPVAQRWLDSERRRAELFSRVTSEQHS